MLKNMRKFMWTKFAIVSITAPPSVGSMYYYVDFVLSNKIINIIFVRYIEFEAPWCK